ncbi:MAG: antitoxin Xre-like helix-turn-helix domain-containing protein [Bryobacteraceae bacterium]
MPAKRATVEAAAGTQSVAAQKTLTCAVIRAAEILEVAQGELAGILGLSPATVSRMASGSYLLHPGRKEWELAALFVRLFRSLDTIAGGHDEVSRAWLRNHNRALAAVPAALLGRIDSFLRVVEYLDASRARI